MAADSPYDAQFRRGYSGPPIPPAPAAAPQSRPAPQPAQQWARPPLAPPPETPTPAPEEIDAERADEPVTRITVHQGGHAPGGGEAAADEALAPASAPAPVPMHRNPFAIALLVASVGMIAIGWWLMRMWADTIYDGTATAEAQSAAVLQQELGPALLLAGIAGLVAWLALGALVVRRRTDGIR